jgi:hypothetical protein
MCPMTVSLVGRMISGSSSGAAGFSTPGFAGSF